MKAVIIAGGEGTRLRPLTHIKPKPLLPLWGKSFIESQIDKLKSAGVKEIIINVGYKAEQFEQVFRDREDVKLSYEYRPMGTAGAVKLAENLFADAEHLIVLNADIVTDFDYKCLINFHKNLNNDVSLFSVKVDDPSRFGLILADPVSKKVKAFLEKTPKKEALNYTKDFYINGGIYVFKSKLFSLFQDNIPLSFEKDVFPTLIVKDYFIRRYDFSGYWLDVGTKEAYAQAHFDFARQAIFGKL